MKSEFLIPFEVDTSAVERKLENNAYNEVVDKLIDMCKSSLPRRGYKIDWDRIVWHRVDTFLDEHADEIIDTTVLLIARKVGNKKRWRDVLDEVKAQLKEVNDSECDVD